MYCPVGNYWVGWGGGANRKYYWFLSDQFLPVLHELFYQLKLHVPITSLYLPSELLVLVAVRKGTSLSFSPTTPLLQSCMASFLPQSERPQQNAESGLHYRYLTFHIFIIKRFYWSLEFATVGVLSKSAKFALEKTDNITLVFAAFLVLLFPLQWKAAEDV